MAQLSDTVRLRNLAVSLDGVKVVGYQHQIMKDYQQIESDETNNIIGEFNSLDKNVAKYCETNNLQLRSCVVDFNRMPVHYGTPCYQNIEIDLIKLLRRGTIFTENFTVELPNIHYHWEQIITHATNSSYNVKQVAWTDGILVSSNCTSTCETNVYMAEQADIGTVRTWIVIGADENNRTDISNTSSKNVIGKRNKRNLKKQKSQRKKKRSSNPNPSPDSSPNSSPNPSRNSYPSPDPSPSPNPRLVKLLLLTV